MNILKIHIYAFVFDRANGIPCSFEHRIIDIMNRVIHHDLCRIPGLMSSNPKSIYLISCFLMQSLTRSILVDLCAAPCGLQCVQVAIRKCTMQTDVIYSLRLWFIPFSSGQLASMGFKVRFQVFISKFTRRCVRLLCARDLRFTFERKYFSPNEKNSNNAVVSIHNHLITIILYINWPLLTLRLPVCFNRYIRSIYHPQARWQTEKVKTSFFTR